MKRRRILAALLALVMVLSTTTAIFAKDWSGSGTFEDVGKNDWFHGYVENLAAQKIVKGYGKTDEYRPTNTLSREEAAKMIAEAAGLTASPDFKSSFVDLDDIADWALPYVYALEEAGVIKGFGDTDEFRPKLPIERGHIAKMLVKAFGLEEGPVPVNLSDLDLVEKDPEVLEAIRILASNGIVSGFGTSNEFRPLDDIDRAAFAKVIAIAQATAAVQQAEKDDATPEDIERAKKLVGNLPDDQDKGTKESLEERLDELEEEEEPGTGPVVVPVSSISVDKEATTLPVGTSETLVVTFDPTNATNKNITWSTSDASVATVADGVVTAVAEGTATITATSINAKTATTTVTVVAENTVAMIGTTQYETLAAAVAAVEDNTTATIKLLADADGSGIFLAANEGKNITIDFGGKTYTITSGPVGSTGYETQGLHLEKGNTVTLKNGKLTSSADSGVKMLVQKYCDLTLEDMELDGTKLSGSETHYVLSNNNGTTTLTGTTTITAAEGDVAFDVYYWPKNGYESVTVEIADGTVKIYGRVEYAHDGSDPEGFKENAKLIIPAGYTLAAPEGYEWVAQDGKQVLIDASTVAMIGPTQYETLAAAVAAVEDNTTATIKLLADADGSGIFLAANEGKNITIDFGGKTYTITSGPVGSTGYETQGLHLEKGNTVTLKNGKLTSSADSGVKMLVQKYCDLTLEDMELDGTKLSGSETHYVLSNNNGTTTLTGTTTITAAEGDVAFDVYYWPKNGYESVTVEIADGTVKIYGRVEYAHDGSDPEGFKENAKLIIPAGYTLAAPEGYEWVAQDGKQVLIDASTVAMIGPTQYETLAAAVAAVEDNTTATIKLLADADGSGIFLAANEGKNITIDFGGKTYTITSGPVGSTGYETQGLHLEKGNTVTLKNGKLTSSADSGVKMLVQKYCDLTLEDMELDGTKLSGSETHYVLSNNNGTTTLTGTTTITAAEGDVAFDVYYWPKNGYESVTVEIADGTVKIYGRVEYAHDGSDPEGFKENAKLIIPAGYTLAAPEGYEWVAYGEGKQVLKAVE